MSKNCRPRMPLWFEPYASTIRNLGEQELKTRLNLDYTPTSNDIPDEINEALKNELEQAGIPYEDVKHFWYKSQMFSVFAKNSSKGYEEIRDEIIADMKQHAPQYPTIQRSVNKDGHLLVIDPADIHIGKLASSFETGEDYNTQIAVQRVKEGVQGILDKSAAWNIDHILFIGGNDILHTDTPKRTTTSGTAQDTDGMWYDNFVIAKKLIIEVLETLMSVADVTFHFNPSNHDYMSGFFLADTLSSWFSKCEHITFDVSMKHRKYFRYYNNLIGTTHADGAKQDALPLLMAVESEDWSSCKRRYGYGHHFHHKVAKDYPGFSYEVLRSPSSTDSWHHRNGYQHAPKAVEGFIHHKEFGQIARLTHLF